MSSTHDWPWERVTGILGVLFFIGIAVGLSLFITVQPLPTDSIADIEEFFADDAGLVHSANWILGVVMVFMFLPFAAGLRAILGRADVDAGIWSRTAYGAAVALVAVTGAGSVFLSATMLAYDSGWPSEFLRWVLWADAFMYSVIAGLGVALFLAASSIVVLRTGVLWNWLGWVGIAGAAICLIGAWWPIDGDPEGVLTYLAFLCIPLLALWSLLAGINLLRAHTGTTGTV